MNLNPDNAPVDPPDSYWTLAGESEAETRIQRSRFVGMACPAACEDEAKGRVEDIGRRFHDARHVCYGFRLGLEPDPVLRRQDDGEPSGTAGEPILKAIERSGLTDVLVVVVRWFGGVKLGTGGLARAYGQAAEQALDGAPRKEVLLGRQFNVRFAYPQEKTLRHLLEQHTGRVLEQDYGAEINWCVWLPHSRWAGFEARLEELTAGQVHLAPVEAQTE